MIPDLDAWQMMLSHPQPSLLLRNYFTGKTLASLPQYLCNIDSIPAGPVQWHTNSTVLNHTCHCADMVAGDPVAVWMAVVHDFGKLTTPPELLPHHYGHEERGQMLAKDFGETIGMPSFYIDAGVIAAKFHMKAGCYHELRFATKRDLLMEIESSGFSASFWKLVDADKKNPISATALADLRRIISIVHNSETFEQWRQKQIAALQVQAST